MQASAQKIWESAQGHLRSLLTADTYNLWFASLRPATYVNHIFSIGVPNEFIQIWLQDNYRDLIRDILAQVSGDALSVISRSPRLASARSSLCTL